MAKRHSTPETATGTAAPADLIGTADAAEELGVSQATLRRWLKDGRVKGHKVGKQWRFRRSDLGSVVQVQDAAAASAPPPRPDVVAQCVAAADERLARSGVNGARISTALEKLESQVLGYVADSDPSARRLLARLILQAVRDHASDLHVEPMASAVKLRYRVDGALYELEPLPAEMAAPLAAEIKRWVSLDPAQRARPMDGRMMLHVFDRLIDIRVSTMPGIHGNAATLRILDREALVPPVDRLGLEPGQLEAFRRAIAAPSGFIPVSGPTGTGKTTTIYAALGQLNTPDRKITTAEDPVEYAFDGITQAQINETLGLGYPRMLVSILRQAPDVIFIGEARDHETAEMLCQAGLTGHLVFSTLHTDDALATPIRLLDMGVEPFLVASSIVCVVAQRLVRQVCPECRAEAQLTSREIDTLGLTGADRERPVYRGAGCERCTHHGYRGRIAVYEILEFDRGVRKAIAEADAAGLPAAARSAGWRPFRRVALEKLFRGETTAEEVIRHACSSPRRP